MNTRDVLALSHVQEARAARGEIEAALDRAGWPCARRLSLWLDALVAIEEATS